MEKAIEHFETAAKIKEDPEILCNLGMAYLNNGDLDDAVPVERAYELEKLISDSGVVIYENCTHYAYLERLGQTVSVLRSFLVEKLKDISVISSCKPRSSKSRICA